MAADPLQDILASPWVAQARADGKAIMVVGKSGRIHHVDDQIAEWLGHDVGANAFDLVPPELAAQGAQTMAEHKDAEAFTVWFPMLDANGEPLWFRWDGRRMHDLLVDALSIELDTDEHHVHVVTP